MAKLSIFCISDIHLGVLDPQYQWENLKEYFFSHCLKIKPDIIAVNGDIMDERVSVNSTTAAVFHMFIDELVKLGSTILIIEGTKSHDDGQIGVFSHRVCDTFRIYNKVTVDNVLGLKILFIPEEYMHDPDEYYKQYLNPKDKYDFIFGHGMATHVATYVSKKKPVHRKLTSPMWDYEKHFKNITNGAINFGHVHNTPGEIGKFIYNKSFGRYNHGEEESKGFTHYIYDSEKSKVTSKKFIENCGAKIFKTVCESELPIGRDNLISDLKYLTQHSYKLRIRFDREVDIERRSDIVSFCKSNLNTSIDNHYDRKQTKLSKKDDKLSGSEMVDNKYENMNIVDATIEFILEKHDIRIDKERILKILNSDDKL